jgi:YesN/AraC family two-component response regulator
VKTILIIEDEAQTRNIFVKCLEFEGFRAFGASDGTTGLAMAQQHYPDLVVCDIMMPDMDGYSVLSNLRKSRQTAPIPLIFLTAKVTMADLRQGMDLGADDYLTKPCTVEQFLAAVNSRLHRHEQLSVLYSGSDNGGEGHRPSQPQTMADLPNPSMGEAGWEDQPQAAHRCEHGSIFPADPHLAQVFRFIEAHYQQPISLNDVAQEVGYSPAYLTSLVQSHTGRTIKQWIIERRMAQARTLLITTTQSVRQVAEAIGYSDAGYFTRQFRQFHSLSPQEWRRQSVAKLTN